MMQDVGMINFLEWREISNFFVCFFLFVSFSTNTGTVIWLEGLALRGASETCTGSCLYSDIRNAGCRIIHASRIGQVQCGQTLRLDYGSRKPAHHQIAVFREGSPLGTLHRAGPVVYGSFVFHNKSYR